MLSPSISVIMPAFNADKYIEKAVLSIINQNTELALEVVVVDDHSTDSTVEVVKALAQQEPAIKLLTNQRTKGPSGARNTGLSVAKGDFIAFLDADDSWYPNHIEQAMAVFADNSNADVLLQNFDIYSDADNALQGDWFTKKQPLFKTSEPDRADELDVDVVETLFTNSFLHLQAVVMKRPESKLLFDESLTRAEDRDFFIQLFRLPNKTLFVNPEVTGTYYLRAGSLTAKNPDSLIKTEQALVKFYDKYLDERQLSKKLIGVVNSKKSESCYELAFLCRQQGQFKQALGYAFSGLNAQFTTKQLVEVGKILVSMLGIKGKGTQSS